jgi:acetylornithine aminotransferase
MSKSIIPFYKSSDRIIEKSVGCYQYDSKGKEYIDFESGVWCANLGHSHKKIVEIIEEQSRKSIHHGYRFRNLLSEKLSYELQGLIGFENGASVFLSSGSESVNLSISIVQRLTKRKKILKISNSYLSAYGFGQIRADNEHLENVNFNDISSLNNIDFSEIAAFVMETGGASVEIVRFPSNDFINNIAKLARANNCLIIAEEVTTGMGRLGKWFGFQNYEIIPDIVVTGKALGNGYPISAVTVDSVIAERLRDDLFVYAQSHQNDPLGCAIGLEVIKIMKEEKVLENCISNGQYFKTQLVNLKVNYPSKIKDVRAKGLMLALELHYSVDGLNLSERLFEDGIISGFKQNTLRFLPPLIITKQNIDNLTIKLNELLKNE